MALVEYILDELFYGALGSRALKDGLRFQGVGSVMMDLLYYHLHYEIISFYVEYHQEELKLN